MTSIYSRILFLISVICLAAPAAGAAESQGTFEVRINPGLMFWQSGWKALAAAPESIDLTKYVGKNSARIFRGSLNTGAFDAIHLKLKEIVGLLKKGQRSAKIKNTIGPLKLPFEIRAQSETMMVLDLVVLDMSDHPPRGYELGVRGYELYTNGKLVDKVPPGP